MLFTIASAFCYSLAGGLLAYAVIGIYEEIKWK